MPRYLAFLAVALVIAACGGGGGGMSETSMDPGHAGSHAGATTRIDGARDATRWGARCPGRADCRSRYSPVRGEADTERDSPCRRRHRAAACGNDVRQVGRGSVRATCDGAECPLVRKPVTGSHPSRGGAAWHGGRVIWPDQGRGGSRPGDRLSEGECGGSARVGAGIAARPDDPFRTAYRTHVRRDDREAGRLCNRRHSDHQRGPAARVEADGVRRTDARGRGRGHSCRRSPCRVQSRARQRKVQPDDQGRRLHRRSPSHQERSSALRGAVSRRHRDGARLSPDQRGTARPRVHARDGLPGASGHGLRYQLRSRPDGLGRTARARPLSPRPRGPARRLHATGAWRSST